MRLVCDYTRARDALQVLSAVHSEAETMGEQSTFVVFGVEDDALSLAERSKQASFERSGPEVHLGAVVVPNVEY